MTPINGIDKLEEATAKGWSLVFFHRPTCPHCRDMKPVVEEAERTMKGIRFLAINCDGWGNYDMERRYSVDGTPALVWFQDGKPKHGLEGMRELKEIERVTEKLRGR